MLAAMNSKKQEFDNKISEAQGKIENTMDELKGFNTDQINEYTKKLDITLKQLNTLDERSEKRYKEIVRLDNSRFRIQVQYREKTKELWSDNIKYIRDKLDKDGFQLPFRGIANVMTDMQDIVIASPSSLEKAKLIRKLIEPKFGPIKITSSPSNYWDNYDMVIHLCPQADGKDSACMQKTIKEIKNAQ